MVCEIDILCCNPTYVLASRAPSPPHAPLLVWIQMPVPDQQLLLKYVKLVVDPPHVSKLPSRMSSLAPTVVGEATAKLFGTAHVSSIAHSNMAPQRSEWRTAGPLHRVPVSAWHNVAVRNMPIEIIQLPTAAKAIESRQSHKWKQRRSRTCGGQ